jgi:hypothetical protein
MAYGYLNAIRRRPSADTSPDRDPMIPKADIVDGEYQRFAHPQAIMVDKPKDNIKEIYKTLNIGT